MRLHYSIEPPLELHNVLWLYRDARTPDPKSNEVDAVIDVPTLDRFGTVMQFQLHRRRAILYNLERCSTNIFVAAKHDEIVRVPYQRGARHGADGLVERGQIEIRQ
jgi:hypothetical protein